MAETIIGVVNVLLLVLKYSLQYIGSMSLTEERIRISRVLKTKGAL